MNEKKSDFYVCTLCKLIAMMALFNTLLTIRDYHYAIRIKKGERCMC